MSLEQKYKSIGAEKAFGNPELIKEIREKEAEAIWIKESAECNLCEGHGECQHCFGECPDCEGRGRIKITKKV